MQPPRRGRYPFTPLGAVAPGGRFSLLLDGSSWLLWDVARRRPSRTGELVGCHPAPTAVALSADGRTVAVGDADGNVIVFALASGQVVWTDRVCGAKVVAVAFAGSRVTAIGADGAVWASRRTGASVLSRLAGVGRAALRLGLAIFVGGLGGGRGRRVRFQFSWSERGPSRD